MYEEYMQNFFNYPIGGYRNTYEQYAQDGCGINYEPRYGFEMVENYPYSYNPNYIQGNTQNYQNRNTSQELEDLYPEIYKIVYPMVRKVCAKNNYRGYSKNEVDRMVEEVYSNIEVNDAVELNITLNNDVRGTSKDNNSEKDARENENRGEKRQIRRNSGLNDLIRILILRELLGRPGCFGPNCRPGIGPRPPMPPRPPRPPFPRYEQM